MDAEAKELCDQFNLIELEQEENFVEASSFDEVVAKGSFCLLAKLHTNRPFNWEAFKVTIQKIWRPLKMMKFYELGSGMISIEFEEKLDKDRVLCESAWNFDKELILLQEYMMVNIKFVIYPWL